MALISVKPASRLRGRSSAISRAHGAAQPSYAPRLGLSDELQLACRLAECRKELLALALLDVESSVELSRIGCEIAGGARLVEDSAAPEAPGSASERFDAFCKAAAELQSEAARVWPSLLEQAPEPAAEGALGPLPAAVEVHRQQSLGLVNSLPLDADAAERILQSAWTATRGAAGAAHRLPPPLRERAQLLEAEVDTIVKRFITANQGLVAHVVQRYRGIGLTREDLMQEGNIGLLRAIEKFDHRRGNRFSVYAIWWIRQAVRRALANQSRTIRIPVHALATRYTLDQASRRLSLELGREPSEQELASATGVMAASVAHVLSLVKEPLSLDAPRGVDNDGSLGESVPDRVAPSPTEQASQNERADHLRELLLGLSAREREMLRMRFGLDGADECTLEQIGQSFALTRERVRQIVTAALGKLQKQSQLRELEL